MPPFRTGLSLTDRALVLAVAAAEADGAHWLDRPGLDAGGESGDDDAALAARARRLTAEHGLEGPVLRALDAQRLLWAGAAAVGIVTGLSAAWAGLAGGGDPTRPQGADLNVLWFLQVTLGLHTLFFVLSLAALAWALGGAAHPLGSLARSGARAVGRIANGRENAAGAAAAAGALFAGRRGPLRAASLGHVAGLGFIAGAIVALLVAAAFREQYRFFWKSTLLSEAQAAGLLDAVAAGPRAFGIPAPNSGEIAAAEAGGGPASPGETADWAWMLVGALLIWGGLPRAAALAGTMVATVWATRRAPLGVSESYRRRALQRMREAPAPNRQPTPAGDHAETGDAPDSRPGQDDRPLGEPAILGYEIDAPELWPPRAVQGWQDLGLVDGAPDRRRVLQELDESPTRPRALVLVFSRGETPAQAERQFLRKCVARARERTGVALTLSRSLASERGGRDAERIAARTALWREAAEAAGVPAERIVEIDLHHLTPATEARVRGLGEQAGPSNWRDRAANAGGAALERALSEVDRWAAGTDHSPKSLATLLQRIDGHFEAQPAWRRAAGAVSAGDLAGARAAVTDGARSLGRMLPGWMPKHPGWMTASATLVTTGTLSAVLLAGGPIGFFAGAWPLYAAAGAAIGELTGRGAAAVKPEPPGEAEAAASGARAAVLHALVLHLQGLPDERIARAVDEVLRDAPEVRTSGDVQALTSHVRERAGAIAASEGGRP